ncbi:hypothetical protein CSO61_002827 [Salmonella enterica subsp. diarizonae]|nr:hypothetical protein [Salmonella enterica subsp. diarizonae]
MDGFYLMKKYTFAARAFIFTLVLLFAILVSWLTISVLKGM